MFLLVKLLFIILNLFWEFETGGFAFYLRGVAMFLGK